ncbi:MAG: DUF4115 domain-containing protein [Alphaproteobacteria bacterium]|nr:DUF4115 domain-containing protein [Alphaproteobacteria bacterium]
MEEKQEILSPIAEMTAGEMLRNARTTGRRKREIATISRILYIREDFLTALEEGNYRVIPEDVYILGFARSYAVELGLDPEVVIKKLKQELGIAPIEEKTETPEPVKKEVVKPNRPTETVKKDRFQSIKKAGQYIEKHWIWFVSGLVAVLAITAVVVVLVTNKTEDIKTEPAVAEPVEQQAEVTEQKIPEPDFRYPVREKFNEKASNESRVVLQAEKESWVKIENARGDTVFSRVLVPGDVYYMPLGDKFKGTFGNAGAIDVWVDGQLIKKVGPANTRKTGISMAPDALKALGFAQ